MSSTVRPPATSGRCGAQFAMATCLSDSTGRACCSVNGYCGNNETYCLISNGCQYGCVAPSVFGLTYTDSSTSSTSSQTATSSSSGTFSTTTSSSSSTSASSSSTSKAASHGLSRGALAGAIIGPILAVLLLAIILGFCLKRRHDKKRLEAQEKARRRQEFLSAQEASAPSPAPVAPVPAVVRPPPQAPAVFDERLFHEGGLGNDTYEAAPSGFESASDRQRRMQAGV